MRDTWKGRRQSDQLPLSRPENPGLTNPRSSGTRVQPQIVAAPSFTSSQRAPEGISRISFRSVSSEVLMLDDKGREEIPDFSGRTRAGPRHGISDRSRTLFNPRTFGKSIRTAGGESRENAKSGLALSGCPLECLERTL